MIINDVRLMRGPSGGFWIALPSVKMVDRDGNPLLNANRKPVYKQVIEFKDRITRDRFCEMVLDLVKREHPEVLADEGTP
jgi:DNA-binding cell septation regulator SpoVG